AAESEREHHEQLRVRERLDLGRGGDSRHRHAHRSVADERDLSVHAHAGGGCALLHPDVWRFGEISVRAVTRAVALPLLLTKEGGEGPREEVLLNFLV